MGHSHVLLSLLVVFRVRVQEDLARFASGGLTTFFDFGFSPNLMHFPGVCLQICVRITNRDALLFDERDQTLFRSTYADSVTSTEDIPASVVRT